MSHQTNITSALPYNLIVEKTTTPATPALLTEGEPTIHEIITTLSGEEIARLIPIKKIIKAVFFKISVKPGFKWLYRYKEVGKKILG